jgi:hypothetical protein
MIQQLINTWQNEMNQLCGLAGVGNVRVQFDKKNHLRAAINGNRAYFGEKILQAPASVRDYVIAHELGHRKSFHEKWFWITIGVATVCAVAIFHSVKFGAVWGVGGIFLIMVVYRYVLNRWMVLEWQADEAGAVILDQYLATGGRAAMLQGMEELRDIRIMASPEEGDYLNRVYASKINRLSGKDAQAWVA